MPVATSRQQGDDGVPSNTGVRQFTRDIDGMVGNIYLGSATRRRLGTPSSTLIVRIACFLVLLRLVLFALPS
ncbi:hypothetical protein BDZ94DRAFT_1249109 [Collybia nuda]|uniref:Uncharacterized protein n=1 Tax=Collybia nuda TaxID=64659 RepID=A0A9P6CMI0_9AGAR|nr:hypothetical protein BDZ94DRAFT_1249109 [Collybia nuda]